MKQDWQSAPSPALPDSVSKKANSSKIDLVTTSMKNVSTTDNRPLGLKYNKPCAYDKQAPLKKR